MKPASSGWWRRFSPVFQLATAEANENLFRLVGLVTAIALQLHHSYTRHRSDQNPDV